MLGIFLTSLINAGEHFKTAPVTFMTPTLEIFPFSSSIQLIVVLATPRAVSRCAHSFITAAAIFAEFFLAATPSIGQLVRFRHT